MNGSLPSDGPALARLDPERRPLIAREVIVAYRRRHLEDTLAELCVEQGYRATTITDVTRRARVARNTVYEHFSNKEAILLALLDRASAELRERVESACAAAAQDSEARLRAGLNALLGWVAEEPASARALFVEAFCATSASMRLYLTAIEGFTALLAGAVPSEVPRPPTTEESLVGGVASLLGGLLRGGEAQRAPTLAPQLLTFLRGPFLATPPAPPGSSPS
jgi:AcrR family transcriptional regulator